MDESLLFWGKVLSVSKLPHYDTWQMHNKVGEIEICLIQQLKIRGFSLEESLLVHEYNHTHVHACVLCCV